MRVTDCLLNSPGARRLNIFMSGGRGLVICFCYYSYGGFNYSDFLVFKIKFLLGCTLVATSTTGLLETSKFKHQLKG